MTKNIKIVGLISVVALIVGALAYSKYRIINMSDQHISATVINVIDRPNRAEDGAYVITADGVNEQRFTIFATGYLNSPLSPESRGESCVQVPKVKVGDKITFNLPAAKQQNTFGVCYPKNQTGYYFAIQ